MELSLRKYARKALFGIPSALQARALSRDPHPKAPLLAEALSESMANKVSAVEAKWIQKIEALRENLSGDQSTLEMEDFGAGDGDSKRTSEEMEQGRRFSMSVAKANQASLPKFWALFLSKLVRKSRSERCLEMGTCLGISAAYVGAALTDLKAGQLITLDGAKELSKRAEQNVSTLGIDRISFRVGRFQDILESTLESYSPVDYVFIDGHHDEMATEKYFHILRPHLAEGALVVFDDIDWSPGMKRAWGRLREDPHFSLSLDLSSIGIGVFRRAGTGNPPPKQYAFPWMHRLAY